jgi:hypothetical protein
MPYLSTGASGVKGFVLSNVQVIITPIFLVLLNPGIARVLNNTVFHFFEWFNHISFFWKLVLLFPGGSVVFEIVMRHDSLVEAPKTTFMMNNFKA